MYRLPPTVAIASVGFAAGAATVAVLAAPGANLLYRIVGGSWHANRATTGVADFTLLSHTSGSIWVRSGGHEVAGSSGFPWVIPEPGIQTSVNDGLDFLTGCSIAAGAGLLTLYYFIDKQS